MYHKCSIQITYGTIMVHQLVLEDFGDEEIALGPHLEIEVGSEPLRTWLESHEIKKTILVTGIEPTTSGLLGQRRSRSDNLRIDLEIGSFLCIEVGTCIIKVKPEGTNFHKERYYYFWIIGCAIWW